MKINLEDIPQFSKEIVEFPYDMPGEDYLQKTIRMTVNSIVEDNAITLVFHSRKEMAVLYNIASGKYDDITDKSAMSIQTGVYRGGSACAIALGMIEGNIDASLLAVDKFDGSCRCRGTLLGDNSNRVVNNYRTLVRRLNLQNKIITLICDSIDMLELVKRYNIRPRMLHLDSSHDYPHLSKEIALSFESLNRKVTSWILVHDFGFEQGATNAVIDFVDNLSPSVELYIVDTMLIMRFDTIA